MTRSVLVWFWSSGGGGSEFAARLAHKLCARFGAGSVQLSLHADDPFAAVAREWGVPTLLADVRVGRRDALGTILDLPNARRVLQEHAHGVDAVILAMNFAAAAPLSLGLNKRLVYCAHDPEPHPGDYAIAMQRITQAILLRRADETVALSEYAGARLRTFGASPRVAPLGSVFQDALTSRVAGAPMRLLLTGRMMRYKGLGLLADALGLIGSKVDWRLRIAGDGPALTESVLCRYAAFEQVTIKRGVLSFAEMLQEIKEADIVLAPYTSATQSGIVAQALSLGKPCVATPVGALSEQIADAGWIAAAATPAALAAVLESALEGGEGRTRRAHAAAALARRCWESPAWDWLLGPRA